VVGVEVVVGHQGELKVQNLPPRRPQKLRYLELLSALHHRLC